MFLRVTVSEFRFLIFQSLDFSLKNLSIFVNLDLVFHRFGKRNTSVLVTQTLHSRFKPVDL